MTVFEVHRNPTLETLKRRARARSRDQGIPLHQAQDEIAQPLGYTTWAALAAAANQTGRLPDNGFQIYSERDTGNGEVRQEVLGAWPSLDAAALAFRRHLEAGGQADWIESLTTQDVIGRVMWDNDYQLYVLDTFDGGVHPVLAPGEALSPTLTRLVQSGHRAMARKFTRGELVDVADQPQLVRGVYYLLEDFEENKDYADTATQQWIVSIGRDKFGHILAATTARFYQTPEFECLFLR